MSAVDFAVTLEEAADQIADIPRAELQIMLRRAALRIRNAGSLTLEPEIEDALMTISDELDHERNDMLRIIVKEWLEQNAYLPVHMLDEDGDVGGNG